MLVDLSRKKPQSNSACNSANHTANNTANHKANNTANNIACYIVYNKPQKNIHKSPKKSKKP